VSVSTSPDMPKILKDIQNGGTEMEDDVQKLIEIIRASLKNKRYTFIWDL